jgi:hypothetical protein
MTRKRIHRLLQDLERSMAEASPLVDQPNAVQDDPPPEKFMEMALHVLERKRKYPKTSEESSSNQEEEINRLLALKNALQEESAACSNAPTIVTSIQELRNVYLHGLQTVSELQDLQDAPDAILPGNFIAPSEVAVGTETAE